MLFRVMHLHMYYKVAGVEIGNIHPPLKITALHTEHVSVIQVGLKCCHIADMLPAHVKSASFSLL